MFSAFIKVNSNFFKQNPISLSLSGLSLFLFFFFSATNTIDEETEIVEGMG